MTEKEFVISSDNYVFRVDAEGYHFSRRAFTYDEWQKIRDFAVKLREERLK